MSEWFDAQVFPPPKDGTWLIAMWIDASGFDFAQFYNGKWLDAEGDEFEAPFGGRYAVWSRAPSWMRPACEARQADSDYKDFSDRIRAENIGLG